MSHKTLSKKHQEHFKHIRASASYQKIFDGLAKGDLKAILLGSNGYGISEPSASVSQSAGMVTTCIEAYVFFDGFDVDLTDELCQFSACSGRNEILLAYCYLERYLLVAKNREPLFKLDVNKVIDVFNCQSVILGQFLPSQSVDNFNNLLASSGFKTLD